MPAIISEYENHAGLLKLRDKALAEQIKAYAEVRAALSSQRYHCLLLTLAAWLENERWRKGAGNTKKYKVFDIATATLAKCYKQLRRQGKHLDHTHPKARHATRIAAKKLRYASEFFASLYSLKKSDAFLGKLSLLQDWLGRFNDIIITEKLLHQLIGRRTDRVLDEALHIFAGWNACNAMLCLAHMNEAWQTLFSKKPFWH